MYGAGGSTVNTLAKVLIKSQLKDSPLETSRNVEKIISRFEVAKRRFSDDASPITIQFASPTDTDPAIGVRRGQIKLQGCVASYPVWWCNTDERLNRGDIASRVFAPICAMIEDAVLTQIAATNDVETVILVGGFGASPYLAQALTTALSSEEISLSLSRPEKER